MRNFFIGLFVLATAAPAFAQKLNVKIIARQDNETEYTYVVAGYTSSNSNTNVNCYGDTSVTCSGSTTTTGVSTPGHQVSFKVRGATYSLLLPDGRVAVVNCESKFAEHMAGHAGNHRSCRMPLVDDIEAEFNGDKASEVEREPRRKEDGVGDVQDSSCALEERFSLASSKSFVFARCDFDFLVRSTAH
jgi:hypothetical protein